MVVCSLLSGHHVAVQSRALLTLLIFLNFRRSSCGLNLLGGNLNWTVDPTFSSPSNPQRVVNFTLTTLFAQPSVCTFVQGQPVVCDTGSPDYTNPPGCTSPECRASARVASWFGTLCIAQLQPCNSDLSLVKTSTDKLCVNYLTKYFPGGPNPYHCISDINKANMTNVSSDRIGRTNAFTTQILYNQECTTISPTNQIGCGTKAVMGTLDLSIKVDRDVVGLVAWLAPYGDAAAANKKEGILLTPCSGTGPASGPCSINPDQSGRDEGVDATRYVASNEYLPASTTNELYWKSWYSTDITSIDSMAWVSNVNSKTITPSAQSSCGVKYGCLALASPALETFVALCAQDVDYSQYWVHGTVSKPLYSSDMFCANAPVKNYFSPSAQPPLAMQVPITPAHFNPTANPTRPQHPYFYFQSSDMDGHQMQQRLVSKRSSNINLNMGSFCMQWGASNGVQTLQTMPNTVPAAACKKFFDFDRDDSLSRGNIVSFSVSGTTYQDNSIWLQKYQKNTDFFQCTQTYGCTFGTSTCSSQSLGAGTGCNQPSAQVFAQNWVSTVDFMFNDVDNPLYQVPSFRSIFSAAWALEMTGQARGSTSVQSVVATYPRFTGTANQPPTFVTSPTSFDPNVTATYTCLYSAKCIIPLYLNDYEMSAAGVVASPPKPSGDAIGILMAVGFATVAGALGDETVSCVRAASTPAQAAALSCPFRLGASTFPYFDDGDIGRVFVRCFVGYDSHPAASAPAKVSSQSLPLCVKIMVVGPPPAFVAPTPGFDPAAAAGLVSLDDRGKLVPGRADVAACDGFPLRMELRAKSDNPKDQVRIYVQDWDVDASLYTRRDYYMDTGGANNPDFLTNSTPGRAAAACGGFAAYGAARRGLNAQQASVAPLACEVPTYQPQQACPFKSIAAPYGAAVEFAPAGEAASQVIEWMPAAARRNGILVRGSGECTSGPPGVANCRQKVVNMDQVVCGAAYSNTRGRLNRWVGQRNPNGDDLKGWRRDHSNGDLASPIMCWRIRLQSPPVFLTDFDGLSTPFAEGKWQQIVDPTNQPSAYRHIPIRYSQTINITFVAQDPNAADSVQLFLVENPGLPKGMSNTGSTCLPLSPQQPMCQAQDLLPDGWPAVNQQTSLMMVNKSACNKAQLTLTWTPGPDAAGLSTLVCVAARDDSTACFGQGPPRATKQGWWGEQQCVVLDVVGTTFRWEGDLTDPNRTSAAAGGAGGAAAAAIPAYVGCMTRIVAAAAGRAPDDSGPGGYPVFVSLAADNGRDAPPPPPADGVGTAPLPAGGPVAGLQVGWRPLRGMEGSRFGMCFVASDELRLFTSNRWCDVPGARRGLACQADADCGDAGGGAAPPPPAGSCRAACVELVVERCQFCVGDGDTLSLLAREYAVETSWLKIWALNSDPLRKGSAMIRDPDWLKGACTVPAGAAGAVSGAAFVECEFRVVVGPVYETGDMEGLGDVAMRYRTTVKSLLLMNPDLISILPPSLTPNHTLPVGTPLCILPCSA